MSPHIGGHQGEVICLPEGPWPILPYLVEAIKGDQSKGKTFPKCFQTEEYPVPIHCNSV